MQASKIELHHKIYAIEIRDTWRGDDGKRYDRDSGVRIRAVPSGLWRGTVKHITTERHENGPKGMTQFVTIKIEDDEFDFPTDTIERLSPDVIKGQWDDYHELVEREKRQKLEREHQREQENLKLGQLVLTARQLGLEASADKATNVYGPYGRRPGGIDYRQLELEEEDQDRFLALAKQCGVSVKKMDVPTVPDKE